MQVGRGKNESTHVLVDVKRRVGRSEDLGPAHARQLPSLTTGSQPNSLVDVVNTDRLEDLSLDNVSDAGLGHDLIPKTSVSSRSLLCSKVPARTGMETASIISLII